MYGDEALGLGLESWLAVTSLVLYSITGLVIEII